MSPSLRSHPHNGEAPGDLFAYNIARGRDLGIANYAEARAYLNLTVPVSWASMTDIRPECIPLLQQLYGNNYMDVELYVS